MRALVELHLLSVFEVLLKFGPNFSSCLTLHCAGLCWLLGPRNKLNFILNILGLKAFVQPSLPCPALPACLHLIVTLLPFDIPGWGGQGGWRLVPGGKACIDIMSDVLLEQSTST